MSIQAVAWALGQKVGDPLGKLILISLANRADHVTGRCWPGMNLIASEADCARETVLRKLPLLVDGGFIEIEKAKPGARKRAHTYRLLLIRCDERSHTPPIKSDVRCDERSHQKPSLMCAPITRGCDTAITTKNLHKNHHYPQTPFVQSDKPQLGKRSDGRTAVQPGTPAFDAWLMYFEKLNAQKGLAHLRDCERRGVAALMTAPWPRGYAQPP